MNKKHEIDVVILCAGNINYNELPIGTNYSNSMIPVNGKPVIAWVIDNLIEQNTRSITIVVRSDDFKLKKYINDRYHLYGIAISELDIVGTILDSLHLGLENISLENPVKILLGDSLIYGESIDSEDTVLVSKVNETRRWCISLIDQDGFISDFVEKKETCIDPAFAVIGQYNIKYSSDLFSCLEYAIENSLSEMSHLLNLYSKLHPIKVQEVSNWIDFGHIDKFAEARQKLIQSRYFNSLIVNPLFGTITKCSLNSEKLENEKYWYENIPKELQVLAPRVVDYYNSDGKFCLVQEYYGYPALSDLYVYGEMPFDFWTTILNKVMQTHEILRNYGTNIHSSNVQEMYINKTWNRVDSLKNQNPFWNDIFSYNEILINGKELNNLSELKILINKKGNELSNNVSGSIIHGDLCFSNILYDINCQIMKLIDPRGNFGINGIYGDPRYDIAKLRHSVCGYYDYIVAQLFCLDQSENIFSFKIYVDENSFKINNYFDNLVQKYGYNMDDVKFIEGLLFISMLPYHKDDLSRQKALYLQGLSLLNEVLL